MTPTTQKHHHALEPDRVAASPTPRYDVAAQPDDMTLPGFLLLAPWTGAATIGAAQRPVVRDSAGIPIVMSTAPTGAFDDDGVQTVVQHALRAGR